MKIILVLLIIGAWLLLLRGIFALLAFSDDPDDLV